MTLSRRTVLKRGGVGLSVLVIGGLVWRATDNGVFSVGDGPAYEPWKNWQDKSGDAVLNIVRAGILAANAHNTQPWRFEITKDRIEVHADTARNLGSFDPYLREMHISLGCALENMRLASCAEGLAPAIELPPATLLEARVQPAGSPSAILRLIPGCRSDRLLYDQIPQRHTHRGAYDPVHMLSAQDLEALTGTANTSENVKIIAFPEGEKRDTLGQLIVSATEQIVADHEMSQDSARWFRLSWDLVQKHRDGVSLDTVGLPPLINAAAKIIPAPSLESSDQQWLGSTRNTHVATAPVLGLVMVKDLYDRPTALAAGQVWQRMHLTATGLGIAMHPLNQPVEMVDRQLQLDQKPEMAKALLALVDNDDWKPTFCFRAGFADRPARLSPRRAIQDVLGEDVVTRTA